MKPATKRKKQEAALAAFLIANGHSPEEVAAARLASGDTAEKRSQEAESVLSFIRKPGNYTVKNCRRCEATFGTSYSAVGYCSDGCRRRDLADIGIKWDTSQPPEKRWGGEAPQIISTHALAAIKQMLDAAGGLTQSRTESLVEPEPQLPSQSRIGSPPEPFDDPFDFEP